jgi:hypothetical protein
MPTASHTVSIIHTVYTAGTTSPLEAGDALALHAPRLILLPPVSIDHSARNPGVLIKYLSHPSPTASLYEF